MKSRHTYLTVAFLVLTFICSSMASSAFAKEPILKMVSNTKLGSSLMVDGKKLDLSGRTSIFFEATEREFAQGRLRVKGLNVAYFDVPQAALTYDKIKVDRKGTLGFAIDPHAGAQFVSYDRKKGFLTANLKGYIDADFMADAEFRPYKDDDYVETPKQPAEIFFQMHLEEPLQFKDTGKEILGQKGAVTFKIKAYEDFRSDAKNYQIALEKAPLNVESSILLWIEVAKRIKIQPVRIGRLIFTPPFGISVSYTGAGLNFGMPQVNEQWRKADVIVSVNEWITVWDPSYWIFEASEANSLRAEVNVGDALEVFFVYDFNPEDMYGGGATWGLGTSGSKIITSDGNARGGIDFTHLAHELGHAIGLPHPDGSPGVSTGTLMCPSGWMNDNPQINSQENKDNVTSPLFTFAFKLISAGPDCTDSTDCGPCP